MATTEYFSIGFVGLQEQIGYEIVELSKTMMIYLLGTFYHIPFFNLFMNSELHSD